MRLVLAALGMRTGKTVSSSQAATPGCHREVAVPLPAMQARCVGLRETGLGHHGVLSYAGTLWECGAQWLQLPGVDQSASYGGGMREG